MENYWIELAGMEKYGSTGKIWEPAIVKIDIHGINWKIRHFHFLGNKMPF